MSPSEWFIQVHPINGSPEAEIYFADFRALLVYVKELHSRLTDDVVRVHTPSGATAEEHDKLKELGCVPM
jgi:hypothetical protein